MKRVSNFTTKLFLLSSLSSCSIFCQDWILLAPATGDRIIRYVNLLISVHRGRLTRNHRLSLPEECIYYGNALPELVKVLLENLQLR